MDDLELTTALASLGLDRENHRAVMLLPLVEVAWADGRVQRAERRRIGQIARKYGIEVKEGWLERWLSRRPSVKTFLAARTVLLALMARSVAAKRDAPAADGPPPTVSPIDTLEGLLDLCERVAEAAGGLFGLAFTVARSERDCIEQIAASLSLGPAVPAGVVTAWEQARRRQFLAEAPTTARRRGPRYGILDQTTHHLNVGAHATKPLESNPDPRGGRALGSLPLPSTMATILIESPPPLVAALDSRPGPPLVPGRRKVSALGPDDSTAPFDTLAARAARAAVKVSPPPVEPARIVPPRSAPESVLSPNSASGPRARRVRGGTTAIPTSERFQEEDDTLPFFDDVNVGTYAMDSEDDR